MNIGLPDSCEGGSIQPLRFNIVQICSLKPCVTRDSLSSCTRSNVKQHRVKICIISYIRFDLNKDIFWYFFKGAHGKYQPLLVSLLFLKGMVQ